MRIQKVQTTALRASFQPEARYWGDETWTKSAQPQRSHDPQSAAADLYTSYPPRWRMRHSWERAVSTVVVRLFTDDGLVGYGEAKGVMVPRVVQELIEHLLSDVVTGADPFDVDMLWYRMYASMRARGHHQGFMQEAMAGVDIALWDLIGKATKRPIHKLLGGSYRDAIRIYASALPGLPAGWTQQDEAKLAAAARSFVAAGFGGVKIGIGFGMAADVRSIEVVREAVGSDVLILADALGSYDLVSATRLGKHLAELQVGWFEAPLPPEDLEGYVRLSQQCPVPIANDLIWTSRGVKDLLQRGARIIPQPEVIKVGITECKRIAMLADLFDLPYAPHVSIGSAIQFAATAQVAASCPNFLISEFWADDNPLGNPILRDPLVIRQGHLIVPTNPGLGISIDESRLQQYALETAPRPTASTERR